MSHLSPVHETAALRSEIAGFLGLEYATTAAALDVREVVVEAGYTRKAVSFSAADGERIQAYLFEPSEVEPAGAVVVLHQHNSEWALGKSEVAGLVGDPLQAFGPALARAGLTVLAPDAVGFESRCGRAGGGVEVGPGISKPHGTPEGWLQYFNHAMHRLVRGELLMRKLLLDVASATSALAAHTGGQRVGVLGHSYGGNTALFAAALDTRLAFACCSGSVCSFRHKLASGTALEMALVIPGFAKRFDLDDLMRCVAPRPLLVVSADHDVYSADAAELVAGVAPAFAAAGTPQRLAHLAVSGGHALDSVRFAAIVDWLAARGRG